MDVKLSPHPRPGRSMTLRIGGALFFLIGFGTVVNAAPPHTFAPGETLTAANLNQTFNDLDGRIKKLETAKGGGVVWKDAAGAIVRVVASTGGESAPFYGLLVADANGLIWQTQPATGTIRTVALINDRYFTTPDCSGPAFLNTASFAGVPPRYPMLDQVTGTYRVVPDVGFATSPTVTGSETSGAGCNSTGGITISLVPLAALTPLVPIVKPASLFTAPAHPEYLP